MIYSNIDLRYRKNKNFQIINFNTSTHYININTNEISERIIKALPTNFNHSEYYVDIIDVNEIPIEDRKICVVVKFAIIPQTSNQEI